MNSRERFAAILVALARTAFCAYRAATQSLTGDEAFSYNNFISGGWSRLYGHYDANNHVVYTILAKLSIRAFGVSEFTLRLPSVLAGFFFALGIAWVLAAVSSSRVVRWTAIGALSLHPLFLDFSVAARGYGPSLALLIWAIYWFLRERDLAAGALLGLSMSANLTILYPAVGFVFCPYMLRLGDTERRIQSCLTMAFTATGVFGGLCYPTLSKASASNFYVGTNHLAKALQNLVITSLVGSERLGLFGVFDGMRLIQFVIVPLLAIFVLIVSTRTFLHAPERRPALAPLAMLIAAAVELIAARHLVGMPYPVDRLGLYLVLLSGLAWAVAATEAQGLLLLLPNAVLACALLIQLITQIQTRYFQIWPYDLPAKDVARRLLEETKDKPPNSVMVSVTWWEQPALEFYRGYYHIAALAPIQRFDVTPLEGFDYYVIHLKDDKSVPQAGLQRLHPLFHEPVSGVLLAREP